MPPAGTKMPSSAVGPRHCGAPNPGWIHGFHPTKPGETVDAQVCFSIFYYGGNDSCWKRIKIRIKHCGAFFLYELPDGPSCGYKRTRYCAI